MAARSRRKFGLGLAALSLLAMLLVSYWPSLRGGFIWDDNDYVVNNWTLRTTEGLEAIWLHPTSLPQWYPMVHTTFWAEYHLWGLDPLGYKIDNLLLHFASSILLWIILRKLKIPGAWLAASVFALHPINVESVAWITERKNVLSLFFYLAAMLVYLRGLRESVVQNAECRLQNENQNTGGGTSVPLAFSPSPDTPASGEQSRTASGEQSRTASGEQSRTGESRGGRHSSFCIHHSAICYSLALTLFVAALLSKTVACSWPVAILLLLYYRNGKITRRQWLEMLPFFAIGGALAWFTAHFEATQVGAHGPEWNLSFAARCLIAGRALWFYTWQLFWPTRLAFVYPKWQIDTHSIFQWLWPAGALAALVAAWIYRKQIGRGTFVGLAFYGAAIFPALGFINIYPMRYTYVADHYQYLAGIGLIVLFVAAMERYAELMDPKDDLSAMAKWLWHVVSTDVPFVLPLMLLTFTQALAYQSKATLWGDTLVKNPDSWMVHLNMGHVYVDQKDWRSAMAEYRKAELLAPNVPDPHYNVGYRLSVSGDRAGGIAEFDKALAIDLHFAMADYGKGNALREMGKLHEAIAAYQQAVKEEPTYADAWYNMGYTEELLHNDAAAKDNYERALAVRPDYPGARLNLAKMCVQRGDMNGAVAEYEAGIEADPRDVRCAVALLHLLARLDREDEFKRVEIQEAKYIPDLQGRLLMR